MDTSKTHLFYGFMQTLCALALLITANAYAQLPPLPPLSELCDATELPGNDASSPVQYVLTCKPPSSAWTGDLVVYAHGYVPAQIPLEPFDVDNLDEGTIVPLLAQGFAFATTSYSKNGYAIEQGGEDIDDLVAYFEAQYGSAAPGGSVGKVYLIGASEGALISTMLLERSPQTYDGALALCGPLGGAPYQIKHLNDFRVVFDYFFPDVLPGNAVEVPEDAFLSWEYPDGSGYKKTIGEAIATDPDATRQLFKVTRAAFDPENPATLSDSAQDILFYNVWGMNDLIQTADGNPYGNRHTWYWGSDNDWTLNIGVDRFRADRFARRYLRNYYQPSGELKAPLVALHTTHDPVVPFRHEVIYFLRTLAAGNLERLTVLPVLRYGHCEFTPQEVFGAFGLLVQKVSAAP